ncbi:MAG: carboxypeptidase-like regulatory domain-containing protein [Vicinamibacteria bacterium]
MMRISATAVAVVLSAATWASAQSPPPRPAGSTTPVTPKPEAIASTEIVGTVVTPDGKPAAKARIALLPARVVGKAVANPSIVVADEFGAFRFDVRGLTSFSLRAQLAPYAVLTVPKASGGRRLSLKLSAGSSLSGQVVDLITSQPLASVAIESAEWDESPYADMDLDFGSIRTTSDAKGRFTLNGISSAGRVVIRARLRGYAAATATSIPPTGLKFRLEPGRSLSGLVIDSAGRPVVKAKVTLRPTLSILGDNIKLVSNASGRFEALGLKMAPYDVTVLADGFAPLLKDAVGADTSSLTIALERAARATGRFVDEANKPIKGSARLRAWAASEKVPTELDRIVTVDTKADGTFELSGLKTGTNSIELRAEDFAKLDRKVEVGKAGEVIALGDVKFERGLVLRGRVMGDAETPVPGARIMATRGVRGFTTEPSIFFADAGTDGRFELKGLIMDTYQLAVTAEGFAPQTSKGAPSDDVLQITMKPVVAVTGHLVDSEGAHVGRARVMIQKSTNGPGGSAVSTTDGRFSVELGETGEMQLSVTAEGFKPLTQAIQATPGLDLGDLILSRGLKVHGTVVDARGTAIAGARVENQTTRQFPATFAETDDKGQFDLTGISEGRVRLSATHSQYTSGQTYVEVKEGEEPDDVKITLGTGGRIEGTVRHRDGSPVGQALVQMFATSFNDPLKPPTGAPPMTVTQSDGSFVIEHIYPGSMSLVLMTGQEGRYTNVDQAAVTVAEGETATVNLTLKATVVRGVVRRPADPPGGLKVNMTGQNTMMSGSSMRMSSLVGEIPWTTAITDTEGRFALKVVGPMTANTSVSPADRPGTLLTKKVDVPDQDEFNVTLDLGGTRVSGRVIDAADSRALTDASASAVPQSGAGNASGPRSSFAKADGSGRFTFELEPGDYDITVGADGYTSSAAQRITVGTSEVSLDDIGLSHGGTLSGRVTLRGQSVGQARVDLAQRGQTNVQSRWTGPDGYFTLTGVPDDTVRLVASNEAGDVGFVMVAPGATDSVEVRLNPAARLNITVIGPKDAVAKASVVTPTVDGFAASGYARVGGDGRATLFSLPGETVVRAGAEDLVGEVVVQTQGGQVTEVVIELKPRAAGPKK